MHQNHRFFKVQHTISILAARKNPRTYCSITFNPTPCNHCQLFWSICQKIMEPKWLTTLKNMIRTKGWNHLKPKLSAELWMKAVHKLCCKKNQWQTTYPYLNHVLSGHITLSAHIQNASFHLYQYNKKDTKGLSSLPLATPQLFTFPQSLRSKSTKFNDSRMMLRKGVKPKDDRKTHNSSASKVPLP